eukprot:CAMPEP_0172160530 /NCGR_PEP_ID=MMETSP1050-20130122/5607_1 /TAXON_ID=233186 /ORGANISM="Cryptomonas curvata, Strain CCAP979/52" /LENGTH=342 /DNA_ID=CAMNT_0012830299 /DNA_START=85 /DNA_END=1110 /DNA_ORIENTATION=-
MLHPLEGSTVWIDPTARDEFGVFMPVQIKTKGLSKTNHNSLVLYLNGQALHNQSAEDGILDLQIHIPQRYGGDRFYNSLMKMGLSIGDEECGFFRYLEAAIVPSQKITSEPTQRANFIVSDYARFSFGCEDAQYVDQRVSESRAQAFGGIYRDRAWVDPAAVGETRSGPGSYATHTHDVQRFLAEVISNYSVQSILDAGCGEATWQRRVPGIDRVTYLGVDIVEDVIRLNREAMREWTRASFEVWDVVTSRPPRAFDLVLCRDALFHLPLSDALRVLGNFDASGSGLLVSHYDEALQHNWPDIEAGEWHSVNLLGPPFNLPPPLVSRPETGGPLEEGGVLYG